MPCSLRLSFGHDLPNGLPVSGLRHEQRLKVEPSATPFASAVLDCITIMLALRCEPERAREMGELGPRHGNPFVSSVDRQSRVRRLRTTFVTSG